MFIVFSLGLGELLFIHKECWAVSY